MYRTKPGSEHVQHLAFPQPFSPLLNVPDQGRKSSVGGTGRRGGAGRGGTTRGSPLALLPQRSAGGKTHFPGALQPGGAAPGGGPAPGEVPAAGGGGDGDGGSGFPPRSPGQLHRSAGPAPCHSSEDERAGEDGKERPGGSAGSGAIPRGSPRPAPLRGARCRAQRRGVQTVSG